MHDHGHPYETMQDAAARIPKPWTDETVRAADVVITVGCGDACPVFPGKRYESCDDLTTPRVSPPRSSVPSATTSNAASGT